MRHISIACNEPAHLRPLQDIVNIFLGQTSLVAPEEAELSIQIADHQDGQTRHSSAQLSGLYQGTYQIQGPLGQGVLLKKRHHKRQHCLALYHALVQATGAVPPWGSLTGIRPTRLVLAAMEEGLSLSDAGRQVKETFSLREDKARLLIDILAVQMQLPKAGENQVSCYIGIPFCPSRCRYCSFLSQEAGDGRLLAPYVAALEQEIAATIALMKRHHLSCRALYIGGGTPTVLPDELLARVLSAAQPLIKTAQETTLEAGRADTITRSKLELINAQGIQRISINPQTLHDQTLQRIGRRHSSIQALQAFALAREIGFDNINMDLIAGLSGESLAMFQETLLQVLALAPESITVHSLAIKRSSQMHQAGDALPDKHVAEDMVNLASQLLQGAGYQPYYLYRQKHMAGNLENVGYARPGKACLYNIDMMEDQTSVLAMGAGSISKRVWQDGRRILRAPNVKNVQAYIQRVGEMAQRKDALLRGIGKGIRVQEEA